MLLRNIDRSLELRSESRLIVSKLDKHVIEVTIMSSKNIYKKVNMPRIIITPLKLACHLSLNKDNFPLFYALYEY